MVLRSKAAVVLLVKNGVGVPSEVEGVISDGGKVGLKVLVDSGSEEGTVECAERLGWAVFSAPQPFDHGATRRWAVEWVTGLMPECEVVVMLTQDVCQAMPGALGKLLGIFEEHGDVGAAYARQLARTQARHFEPHARVFNYPSQAEVRPMADTARLGMKTCFFSDSFSAYRVDALEEVGGFPERAIVGEEVIVAAKLLKGGLEGRVRCGRVRLPVARPQAGTRDAALL